MATVSKDEIEKTGVQFEIPDEAREWLASDKCCRILNASQKRTEEYIQEIRASMIVDMDDL